MSKRTASWLAWSMCALSLALTALSLWLLLLNLSYPRVPIFSFWAESVLQVIGYSTVGAVIVSRGSSKNPVGWLLCTTGLLFGIAHFTAEYVIYTQLAAPGSLPGGDAAAWIYTWPPYLALGLFAFIILLFPNGQVLNTRWRWFARLSAFLTAVATVLVTFSPGPIVVGLPQIHNPLGIQDLPSSYRPLQVLMIVLISIAATSLLMRWVRARGVERQQIKWFTYATAVGVSGIILQYIISEPLDMVWLGWVGRALVLAGLAGIPTSIGIAIIRYRLYEIDLIINRTLVYGSLTGLLALLYFGSVTALQYLFSLLTGQGNTLAIVVSTLAIAALFNPLRRRIQGFVDKRFYRRKYDAAKILEAFGSKLRDQTDLEKLCEDLAEVVDQTMQPAHVSVILRSEVPTTREQGQQDQQTTKHEG